MIDDNVREIIWQQVDFALALQGEDIDPAASRVVFDRLIAEANDAAESEEGSGIAWPKDNKRGEQTTLITRLALRVMEEMGQAPPEQVIHAVPDIGKWADKEGAPEIIRRPIGADNGTE